MGPFQPLVQPRLPDVRCTSADGRELRGYAATLAMTFQRGRDDFASGRGWAGTANQYEDADLRKAYIEGYTQAELDARQRAIRGEA